MNADSQPSDSPAKKKQVASNQPQQGGQLGTFAGVFTPSVLTILGIILFLRLGYVVGQAGLTRALIIIAIANGISILTSISLSAVATNLRVGAGGDYYLISRTLGPGFGASIGIVLFMAQAVSIAFYAIGFGEASSAILVNYHFVHPQLVAGGAVAVLFVFAWLGADWATRFQYGVMVALVAGLVSFFVGATEHWDSSIFASGWAAPDNLPAGETLLPFWAIFAIFFPAVTGFTQGVSMSGDLKDAGKSIPRGTFLAVGVSAVIYFAVAILFAGTLSGADLATETDAMWKVSKVSWLADAGVIAATLSSALASFMGAPRILQSLASDRIFPLLSFFAKGSGPTNNPRRGVLLSGAIAGVTIWAGDLNIVAPVVSMFFLISYGLLNYATYVEARSNSPYFRPRFRWFHPRLSLLGAVGCLIAMVALDPTAAAVSAAILYAIFQYVDRRSDISRWADGRRSSRFQRIRQELHEIADEMWHPRDWRPVLLVFTNDAKRRERLIRFASWIEGGAGFTTVVKLLPGQGARMEKERELAEAELKADIDRTEIEAFPLVVTTPDLSSGLSVLLQSQGLGSIHPNTILMNWFDRHPRSDSPPGLESFGTYLQQARRRGCNVVLLEATDEDLAAVAKTPAKKRTIDVWFGEDASGPLMLLFAYLMTRDEVWKRATIRLFAAPREGESHEQAKARLTEMLNDVRIEADPEVVDTVDEKMIMTRSSDASIVLLPFRLRGDSLVGGFGVRLTNLLELLPMSALVLAAQDIDLDARPEEGPHGEIAEAMDTADSSSEIAAKAAKEATEAAEALARSLKELDRARNKNADPELIAELEAAHEDAVELHDRAVRRAAKTKAKAEQAERDALNVREASEE